MIGFQVGVGGSWSGKGQKNQGIILYYYKVNTFIILNIKKCNIKRKVKKTKAEHRLNKAERYRTSITSINYSNWINEGSESFCFPVWNVMFRIKQ